MLALFNAFAAGISFSAAIVCIMDNKVGNAVFHVCLTALNVLCMVINYTR